jgi:transposase-like protein
MARRADSNRGAFWRKLIEGRQRSGHSVARVCEEAGVSPASYYQWQRKLRGTAPARSTAFDRGAAGRLVPVHIVADAPIDRHESVGSLEIELPGEVRLRIPAGCDRATLQLVLSMLLPGGSREAGSC